MLAVDRVAATSQIDKAVRSDNDLSNRDAKRNEDYGEVMEKASPDGVASLS